MNRKLTFVISLGFLVMVLQTVSDSQGISYLSDNPEVCVNCHNMRSAYNSWKHSSHGRDTSCNSCHVPQDSLVRKYFFKASDGIRHAAIFTLGMEPQNPILNKAGEIVVQENCIRCHDRLVKNLSHPVIDQRLCWDCHSSVPHGKLRSISSSPIFYSVRP